MDLILRAMLGAGALGWGLVALSFSFMGLDREVGGWIGLGVGGILGGVLGFFEARSRGRG